ncbi:MAG: HD-GYP domain-containing protein [Gammaproteobacteria bacterium]|jgi:HD-GYP domain-containing protein (c-di-GMP phosphodiesterase class II)
MPESVQKFIKVNVDELSEGMYVSKLDRPWTDTPFLFQGFRIESGQEIDELKQHCQYVFVDQDKSTGIGASLSSASWQNTIVDSTTTTAPNCAAPTSNEFRHHMKHALKVHANAKSYINKIMADVRGGRQVNIREAKSLVSSLAKDIVENPTALMWLTQLKDRDEYTSIHSLNVCILALFFGRSLQLDNGQLNELGLGALMHDIGKLRVPLEILNKPGRLTDEEFDIMKQHAAHGYELLKTRSELTQASLDVIQHHHERIDGNGYPFGLVDEQIGLYSKIVKIVDVYDAVTSKRVYQAEVPPYHALNCIYSDRNSAFDESLVQQFLKHMGIYPVGSTVELSTGEIGVVTTVNEKRHLTPTLLLVLDPDKQPMNQCRYINLANDHWKDKENRPRIRQVINPVDYNLDVSRIFSKEAISIAHA